MDVGPLIPVSASLHASTTPYLHASLCLLPPTYLDECGFFISLVVRLPHSLTKHEKAWLSDKSGWYLFCTVVVFFAIVMCGGEAFLPMPPPFFFFLTIIFIGVTWVNKTVWVSSVQFCHTSSVYCIVCPPPQVKSAFNTVPPSSSFLHPITALIITIP